jgi:PPP family 3-phenylpropionic acid transporter
MDVLGKGKKSYGKIRVWGSISFILTVIILGKIIDLYSINIILILILTGSILQAVISTRIPDIQIEKQGAFSLKAKALLKRRVIIFLFSAFLMLVSHGTYYGFFSIHLDNLGYESTFIGITWALASISEILVMVNSEKIFKRFSLENVLVFSFMVAALRWFTLFIARSPAVIMISQISHAVTYGTFHIASILYIDFLTPDDAKTLGQAINNAVTYGLGMMVGFFMSGYLYESMGSFVLFMISGFIALAGGILLRMAQMMEFHSL